MGYVRFDPKFPKEAWLWLWVNLCFTCVAEEALFRGFIQAQLGRWWAALPRGEWLALVVAASNQISLPVSAVLIFTVGCFDAFFGDDECAAS